MKKLIVFVFVLLLVIATSVGAQESTSPVCSVEELEEEKALNHELYEACKANDGAFLCTHGDDGTITTECRALSRTNLPGFFCGEDIGGGYPAQNINIDGTLSEWECQDYSFYKNPLILCTEEEYKVQKEKWGDLYNYTVDNDGAFLCRYDLEDSITIATGRILIQDSTPATIKCEEGTFPVQNFFQQTDGVWTKSPWHCETFSRKVVPTIIQSN